MEREVDVRQRLYNWEYWFSRSRTVLLRGVDYRCSQSTMVQIVRNNASRMGILVSIKDTETELVIEVRSGKDNTG